MKYRLFEYPTPFANELVKMYPRTPWWFSDELIETVERLFKSPRANKRWYKEFNEYMIDRWDARDMLVAAWRRVQYFQDYPQQFGHSIENVADSVTIAMYRMFFWYHRIHRKNLDKDTYYKAQVKVMMPYILDQVIPPLLDRKNWKYYEELRKKNYRNKSKNEGRKLTIGLEKLALKVERGEWE